MMKKSRSHTHIPAVVLSLLVVILLAPPGWAAVASGTIPGATSGAIHGEVHGDVHGGAQGDPASVTLYQNLNHYGTSHLSQLCNGLDKQCSSGGCCAVVALQQDIPIPALTVQAEPVAYTASVIEAGVLVETRPPNA